MLKPDCQGLMYILHVVGARPNFMKEASVIPALTRHDNMAQVLVHTGQHYDINMSDVFFRQLCLPQPDINLEVGSRRGPRRSSVPSR